MRGFLAGLLRLLFCCLRLLGRCFSLVLGRFRLADGRLTGLARFRLRDLLRGLSNLLFCSRGSFPEPIGSVIQIVRRLLERQGLVRHGSRKLFRRLG